MNHVANFDLVFNNAIDQSVWTDNELTEIVALKLGHPSTAAGEELEAVRCREDLLHEVCCCSGRILPDSARDGLDFVECGVVPGY